MGGRGGSSGKGNVTGGVGSSGSTSKAQMGGGSSSSSVGVTARPFRPSKTPVSKMSDKKLKEELIKAAGHWYASGKSGISFGQNDPYQAAATLVNQKTSRASMERDYKSIMKKLK